jgi:NADH:ubiquinone oxidoreductase subunit 5 (subunit L)/multisubunit Na+/H+ antiporter MnhA subunit
MDSLQSLLALAVLLAPLLAAAAIAVSSLVPARRTARLLAAGGAAVSFVAAAIALARLVGGGLDGEAPLSLGVWLTSGPRDPFQITFAIALDLPAALLAALMSLSTFYALVCTRPRLSDSASERLLFVGASLLLSSSLGIALSANVGELFVFWQIAAVSSYLMWSAASESGAFAAAAKKFIVVQRCAEFCLLCAVFAFAAAYRTLDYDDLLQYLRFQGVSRFALVHFIGLCLLGACAARCALFPFLGWLEGLTFGPVLTSTLVEGICVVPAGVLLLIRFVPALHAAAAAAVFAVFLGGASAFFSAICAWSETEPRRQAVFACASVMGIIVLGLALPVPVAPAWSVVLTAVFIPTSAAVLVWSSGEGRTGKDFRSYDASTAEASLTTGAVAVSIVVLFSGICGQGGIVGAALNILSRGAVQGGTTLALTAALSLAAEFFAALAMTRALLAARMTSEIAAPLDSVVSVTVPAEARPHSNLSHHRWLLVVPAACGILVGLAGGALILAGKTSAPAAAMIPTLAGGSLAATLLGCLPALAGFFIGWTRPRRAPADPAGNTSGDLLTRLGRKRFYGDAFLLAFVALPTRAIAQGARFIDWFLIDGFVSGAPASAVESAGAVLEPIQERSVLFYLTSAAVGTGLLAAVVVGLRY